MTVAVAILAFLLVEVFSTAIRAGSSNGQVPFFVVISALDSLLGAGIAFIAFSWSAVRRMAPVSRLRAVANR